ncbi:MAG: hypothetical protein EAX90_13735 [Candidatus Heimdallarchaeota archaeon]|nr:hypothetical protein [Candidatus Heimdallarchaeota archaeon]
MFVSLEQIWILQESGTCLFHRKYNDNNNDENLISGFLSAVNSFVGSFGDEIKWIETNRHRFVFKMSTNLIYCACTSIDSNAILTYKRLSRISDHFMLMFKKHLFDSGEPIPIDIFKKIAPTVNRIFAIPEESGDNACSNTIVKPTFRFDSNEARLMSFIRYKRKVSLTDIVHFLRVSDTEADNALRKLEDQRQIMRIEYPDGTEQFGLHPVFRGAF